MNADTTSARRSDARTGTTNDPYSAALALMMGATITGIVTQPNSRDKRTLTLMFESNEASDAWRTACKNRQLSVPYGDYSDAVRHTFHTLRSFSSRPLSTKKG